jgi:hypothetical protein
MWQSRLKPTDLELCAEISTEKFIENTHVFSNSYMMVT